MLARLMRPGSVTGDLAFKVREGIIGGIYGRTGIPREVNGLPVRVVPSQRCFFPKEYDPPVAAFFRERIKPGSTCVNVGANLGIYALQFAHWAGPAGRVIAFEPNPITAGVLRRHLEMNGVADRVRVVERAVSSAPGKATFYLSGTEGMSRLGSPNPMLSQTQAIEVEVTTLDAFCTAEGVAPDWVLIDVEGFEVSALAGFRETIAARPGMGIVVEMHSSAWPDAGSSREAFEALLAELRLRPVPLSGQADPMSDYGLVHMERVEG